MKKYNICVYAICKDEERFTGRWMESMNEADVVVVTDTGSKDGTVEALRGKGALVYKEKIMPWRFDTARNISLKHVPADADICVCTDLDEVFEPGWRDKLEKAWKPGYTRAVYSYIWSHNPDGTPNARFTREKIHCRNGFKWVHPVHEVLKYEGTEKTLFIDGITLHHYPDPEKSRGQYLPLLELSASEDPDDDRTAFWLGREYMYNGMYDKAIKELRRHLKLPSALWEDERSASMRFIAYSYKKLGDMKNAYVWLYRAIAENPGVRESYLDMAELGYAENNWPLVYAMSKKGLEITEQKNSYLTESRSWGGALYDYASLGAYNLGLFSEALELAEQAVILEPEDERLKRNAEIIENMHKGAAGNVWVYGLG